MNARCVKRYGSCLAIVGLLVGGGALAEAPAPSDRDVVEVLNKYDLVVVGHLKGKWEIVEKGNERNMTVRQVLEIEEVLKGASKQSPVMVLLNKGNPDWKDPFLNQEKKPNIGYYNPHDYLLEGVKDLWFLTWLPREQMYVPSGKGGLMVGRKYFINEPSIDQVRRILKGNPNLTLMVPLVKDKSNEAKWEAYKQTKQNLGGLRSAVSTYYGKNEGEWPQRIDDASFVGAADRHYIAEIPEERFTGNRRVQYVKDVAEGDGRGGWLYCPSTGQVWVNLKGTDLEGNEYSQY